ncbi:class I adenylate-forming enzyme family protein [Novosphingobium mathurense]|uniref:3-methylmercaptopropionyl-CoA ligase n=1 Tax=Novosphingobium mathurense TaxID=428990 RepID=A0A1U6IL78_9SPHN|nr:AMP-binding protein [Novosphingobium mathurense]SLK08761.1 long-chain acyl-CoA synthetase [Novosphingobium mathurense]
MNLALWLWRTAKRMPDAPALFRGTEILLTYRELGQHTAAIATGLQIEHGIAPGDRVALFLANDPEYLPLLYAIWAAGGVAVPINAKLHEREAAWIMEDAGARLAFVDAKAAKALSAFGSDRPSCPCVEVGSGELSTLASHAPLAEPVERARDDLAWLFYTSGTTGRPKGVMLSNGNLHAMTYAYLTDVDDPGTGGTTVYAAPFSHGAGLYALVHVLRGCRHVVPASGGFDADALLELGRHFGDVSLFAAPTMVKRLVDHARNIGADGEGLRTIVYGGGPMYTADIEEAVAVMGPRFVQIYGQGECPMTITALSRDLVADRGYPRWRERLGSVGVPHSCVEVRIANKDGKPCPVGETGEVLVRGAPVMLGYWNNPEATAATLREGWLWTGDMGALDEDGFLTLKDRSKDVIISGGTNIYPREVEEALLSHPDVAEACVLGRPHAEWGEEVVAFVVPRSGQKLGPEALDRHCLERIARFKRPKAYRFTDELPKNNYGKVLKTALRERLAAERENNHAI